MPTSPSAPASQEPGDNGTGPAPRQDPDAANDTTEAPTAPVGTYETRMEWVDMEHAGKERRFLYYVPPSLSQAEPVDLLVLIHGGSGSPDSMIEKTFMKEAAEKYGFIVMAPEGLPMETAPIGSQWKPFGPEDVLEEDFDDPGFVVAALDWMLAAYPVDRVVVAGHSIGGPVAYDVAALASDRVDLVVGVSAIIGLKPTPADAWLYVPKSVGPMDVVIVHATDDDENPYEGGNGVGIRPQAEKTSVAQAIAWFEEPFAGIEEQVEDHGDVQYQLYQDTASGHRVMHIRTVGGHGWPGGGVPEALPYSVLVTAPPEPDVTTLIATWLKGDLPSLGEPLAPEG